MPSYPATVILLTNGPLQLRCCASPTAQRRHPAAPLHESVAGLARPRRQSRRLLRASVRYAALRPVYTAATEEAAQLALADFHAGWKPDLPGRSQSRARPGPSSCTPISPQDSWVRTW